MKLPPSRPAGAYQSVSRVGRPTAIELDARQTERLFQSDYGYFTRDGLEYVITRPDTPKPWTNIICPGEYGVAVSQAGGGYSWNTHASLNRITRWEQDLVTDQWGKYFFIRDEDDGKSWSATWKPICHVPESYECRHGIGYTTFSATNEGVRTKLTVFVPADRPMEVWRLVVTNLDKRPRHLSVWTYLEWCLGVAPDNHREFHKTFLETEIDMELRACFASKRLWAIDNEHGQQWNRDWGGVAWHTVSDGVKNASGSKEAFIGQNGSLNTPAALKAGKYLGPTTRRWDDSIASLCVPCELDPGQQHTMVFTIGVARDRAHAEQLIRDHADPAATEQLFNQTIKFWQDKISASQVSTPDDSVNLLTNHWLKYQAMSARLWGRTGYYQTGGAYGYRDQLQDSQLFLHIEPRRCRDQIMLHAAHQFTRGHVLHWWHPITETGLESGYSDDLLWLPFVTLNYLRETGDFRLLSEQTPFLHRVNEPKQATDCSLFEHCRRAIDLALERRSNRGLPLIGTGDWNDGLAVAGWHGRGESVWVGMFLYRILLDFADMIDRALDCSAVDGDAGIKAEDYRREANSIRDAVNTHGWDGQWYWTASTDDGALIGSHMSTEGRIHLNPQTWSILTGIAPVDRIPVLLQSVETHLYRDYGPLLLQPAYTMPDERIGYLTRYAPGVRENGGFYTHAGTWAIQMECKLKRADRAWRLFRSLAPPLRGLDPELYQCEPYVTPGNVDGPDSPFYGRGGWTWYTGSAAWLYLILTEWLMGVRPTYDGLLIDPCIPSHWEGYKMRRQFRDCTYNIEVVKSSSDASNINRITMDGQCVDGRVIPPVKDAKDVDVKVILS